MLKQINIIMQKFPLAQFYGHNMRIVKCSILWSLDFGQNIRRQGTGPEGRFCGGFIVEAL